MNHTEKCSICLELLTSELYENGLYTIKECRHQFHTDCFLSWCKQGVFNCPLCRTDCVKLNFLDKKQKLSFLRKLSLKKCSPVILKELANNFRSEEKKLKVMKRELKVVMKENKIILDNIRCKRIKIFNQYQKLSDSKDSLLGFPILELSDECRIIIN